jgi:TolA-binding protein
MLHKGLGAGRGDGGSAASDESNKGAGGAGDTQTGGDDGSDVSGRVRCRGLQAAMADSSAKVEEVAGQKVQFLDCEPRVKKDLTSLEQELATMNEEVKELRVHKVAMVHQRLRDEQDIRDVKQAVEVLRKANDDQWKSQERETQAVANMRKVIEQLTS